MSEERNLKNLRKYNKVMSSLITRIVKKLRALYKPVKNRYFQSKQEKNMKAWRYAKGDKTYRLKYDLTKDSLVFDIGGYEGQWASDIFSKYSCRIYIFEPVLEFASNIEKKFNKNKKILIYKFGLGKKSESAKISLNKDSTSLYRTTGKKYQKVKIIRAIDFLKENDINKIDLMKINIEGGEYDLLEDFIESGEIKKIRNIQVQFHNFILGAKTRMSKIQKSLRKTHVLTYQYRFIWENWQKKRN